ncbi:MULTISPECIES: PIG-L deacetylase family protein [unclassified Crossiella]|uniref:PIG-L deacetylase family protein n=1 Tax=unclassified Crossiella TaxID=2620835 RepID=UPI0020001123|nr:MULTISPECIES: PIG-L family deacetylase [unclassified Crossiella]MCK2244363.1 PIG-L family deacetylase [Crossiella sp. S99.2]MCK2257809.1 PIG-L family deacetylase [Crossiella sp. S99.1]
MTELPDAWRPIALPHTEVTATGIRFLGRPVEPPPAGPDLLARCDGTRALRDFPPAERDRLRQSHRAGLLVLAPPPRPRAGAAPVVVSPHPDDAVLALGGLLAARGGRVLDVFSVETWTSIPYYAARPELTTRLLAAEELVACRVLGADPELLGFLDAADRPEHAAGFLAPDPAAGHTGEPELFAALTARLAKELTGCAEVYLPLAVGGHVDHLLCREAVLALAARGALPGSRLVFYEDQPYSLFTSAEELSAALAPRLRAAGLDRLRPRLLPMDATAGQAKQEALKAYRIQVRAGIRRRVARYERALAGPDVAAERVWS